MNITLTQATYPNFANKELTKKAKTTFPHNLEDTAMAIRLAEGNLTKAADLLEVSRPLLQRKVDLSPALGRVVQDVVQQKLDKAEDKLMEAVDDGNVTAITFLLRTLGKERGYTEKNTLEHELGKNAIDSAAAMIEALRRRERAALPEPATIELPKEDATWQETSDQMRQV